MCVVRDIYLPSTFLKEAYLHLRLLVNLYPEAGRIRTVHQYRLKCESHFVPQVSHPTNHNLPKIPAREIENSLNDINHMPPEIKMCLSYRNTSSKDIQNTPGASFSGSNRSRESSVQILDPTDHSPFHDVLSCVSHIFSNLCPSHDRTSKTEYP